MSRAARHLPFDTAAGFDEPLEVMLGCHRRIERQLESLKRLRIRLAERGVDVEASAAAQSLLAYFDHAAAHHHEDEEADLFPLLARRITDPAEHVRFLAFRDTLATDHRQLDAAWARLRRPLEAIGDGLRRVLPEGDVGDFATAYAKHIVVEEYALAEFFHRWLDEADREALGRAMAERRRSSHPQPPA